MTNDPTYAELDSIDMDAKAIANQNPIGTLFAWRKAYLTAFARAVSAKWGTPAPVGVEPNLYQVMAAAKAIHNTTPGADVWDALRQWEIDALRRRAESVLNAADRGLAMGRVPLPSIASAEMIDAAMVEMRKIYPPLRRSECRQLIDAALSAAHGIKGGQHGAE